MNYRNVILSVINANHGLKAIDLSLKIMEWMNPTKFSSQEFAEALDSLILDDEIIELPYTTLETIKNVQHVRQSSIYFPKGTRICVAFLDAHYFRRVRQGE